MRPCSGDILALVRTLQADHESSILSSGGASNVDDCTMMSSDSTMTGDEKEAHGAHQISQLRTGTEHKCLQAWSNTVKM